MSSAINVLNVWRCDMFKNILRLLNESLQSSKYSFDVLKSCRNSKAVCVDASRLIFRSNSTACATEAFLFVSEGVTLLFACALNTSSIWWGVWTSLQLPRHSFPPLAQSDAKNSLVPSIMLFACVAAAPILGCLDSHAGIYMLSHASIERILTWTPSHTDEMRMYSGFGRKSCRNCSAFIAW